MRRWVVIAVLAIVLIGGGTALSHYADILWFDSLGYADVFWKTLRLQSGVFIGFSAVMFLVLYHSFLALKPPGLGELTHVLTLINGQPLRLPSVRGFWDSSATVFRLKAKGATGRSEEIRSTVEDLRYRGVAQPGSAPALDRLRSDSMLPLLSTFFLGFSSIRGYCFRFDTESKRAQNDRVLRQFRDRKKQLLDFREEDALVSAAVGCDRRGRRSAGVDIAHLLTTCFFRLSQNPHTPDA